MREISYNKDYVKLDGGFYFAQGVFETILIKKEAIINNIDILEASVKKDNMLSRKIFINNGFFEIEKNDKYLYLYFLKKEKEIV